MKINKKLLLFIFSSILIFFFVNEISNYLLDLNNAKKELYSKNKILFNTIRKMQTDSIQALSLMLSNDEGVKKAYIENDPEIMKQHIAPFWEKVKKEKFIYEIHFFKPPAQSFVNFSNFNSIGKDVSDARMDISWVTSSFKSSTHIMMCKTYAGLRATYPILDKNGNMLGGLSMGKKIDWLPKTIKNILKSESFLVYDKDSTHSLVKKYYDNFMKDKQIIGKFILANKTLSVSVQDIKDIDFTKDIQDIVINNKQYSLNIFKIIDFEKKGLAYLCILNDLDSFNENFLDKIIKNLFLLIFVSIVLYIILTNKLIVVINKIKSLQNITKELKNNNFKILKNINQSKNIDSKDEISILEEDIIDMGKSLEQNHHFLEEEVEKRTIELEYEKNYIKKILDLTPDITLVTNGNKLISANQRFFEFVEYETLDKFLEKYDCICDYFITVDDEKFSKDKTIDGKIWSLYIAEYSNTPHTAVLKKNDDLFYFHLKAVYLDENEVLVTLQDITEIQKKDKLIFEQSKMASMGEMIGNIAHQWRQPLSVISTGATGMIMQKEYGLLTDEQFVETCNSINDNVQYLSKTIDDFRNFIEGDRKLELFNLKENIESLLHLVEGSIKSYNIDVILYLDKDISIEGYPNELVQCFINIFNNSKDILINKSSRRLIFISTYILDHKIYIEFKDNAGGIDEKIISKIFDPYFTTKHQSQGTGLGLNMTYTIITDGMNGSINPSNVTFTYDNKNYKGAQFKICLPVKAK